MYSVKSNFSTEMIYPSPLLMIDNRDETMKSTGNRQNEAFILTVRFLSNTISLSLSLSFAFFPIVQTASQRSRSHRVFRAPKGTSSHGWGRTERSTERQAEASGARRRRSCSRSLFGARSARSAAGPSHATRMHLPTYLPTYLPIYHLPTLLPDSFVCVYVSVYPIFQPIS